MPKQDYTLVILEDNKRDVQKTVSWSGLSTDLTGISDPGKLDFYIAHQESGQYKENHHKNHWCFIRSEDIQKFIEFAETHNMYIGVRDTGALSLNRIGEGCACKPHNILEKSIKNKSVLKEYEKFKAIQNVVTSSANAAANGLIFRFIPRVKQRDEFLPFYTYENVTFALGIQEDLEFEDPSPGQVGEFLKIDKEIRPDQVTKDPAIVQTLPRNKVLVIDSSETGSWRDLMNLVEHQFGTVLNQRKDDVNPRFAGYVGAWATLVVEATSSASTSSASLSALPAVHSGGALAQQHPPTPFNVDRKDVSTVIVNVPMGVLRVDGKRPSSRATPAPKYGDEVDLATISGISGTGPADSYTGDYDLHEVFITKPGGRVTEPSPLPAAPPGATTGSPGLTDISSIEQSLKILLNYKRKIVTGAWTQQPTLESDDLSSRVQHGPQNMYRQFIDEESQMTTTRGGGLFMSALEGGPVR